MIKKTTLNMRMCRASRRFFEEPCRRSLTDREFIVAMDVLFVVDLWFDGKATENIFKFECMSDAKICQR